MERVNTWTTCCAFLVSAATPARATPPPLPIERKVQEAGVVAIARVMIEHRVPVSSSLEYTLWELEAGELFKGSVGEGISTEGPKRVVLIGASKVGAVTPKMPHKGGTSVFFLKVVGPFLYTVSDPDGTGGILPPDERSLRLLRALKTGSSDLQRHP